MKQYVNLRLFRDFEFVCYYTFHLEDSPLSEAAKFFEKLKNDPVIANDLNRLAQWIVEIGEFHGALMELFRFEEEAHALPPPPRGQRKVGITQIENNALRLYCVWISESIVILANGGIKTSQTVQDSPNVLPHFRFAKAMGRQINQLIAEGSFKFKEKEILNSTDIELFI